MNLTTKLLTGVTATVVATAIGVGSMASAAAPTPAARPAVDVQAKCAREPQITAQYDKTHAALTKRIANLQERHDKAVANDREKLATRLERLINRLQQTDTKITNRYDKYQTWFDANCQAG
jgi:hypothetical protein